MEHGSLIAFPGAVIIASSSPLLAGASAASAAADTEPGSLVTIPTTAGCAIKAHLAEARDSSGAYVALFVDGNPCNYGIEAGITGPGFTPSSWGADVRNPGSASVTGTRRA
jgi:hypothetical protein